MSPHNNLLEMETASAGIKPGFEAAHAEWVKIGGKTFRDRHRPTVRPDFYRSQYWKLVKEAVLISKSFKCCRCGGDAKQVHHLHYDFIGEDHFHPESLVAICRPCHGLVEHARNAEALISRISRRISLCNGFMEDRRGCLDQNAIHVAARLLEYREDLGELRRLFATQTFYTNPRNHTETEREAFSIQFKLVRQAYEESATKLVSSWEGTEKEKAQKLIPLLESEIQNCRQFVIEVFAPVAPNQESSPHIPKTSHRSGEPLQLGEVESLVVGIKYHRGHLDGLSQGDPVLLLRESTNAYDANAIQIKLESGETLGYVTSEFAAAYAPQMDAGTEFRARISRISKGKAFILITKLS